MFKLYILLLSMFLLIQGLSAIEVKKVTIKKASSNTNTTSVIEVKKVTIKKVSENTYVFSVTLKSPDTGWDYYSDGWQVIDSKTGKVYGTRVLAHPHTNEQPFTRSKTIKIPSGVNELSIVAKMNTDATYPKKGYKFKLKDK